MKRVHVELSPNTWPERVRSEFERVLFPLFSLGLVDDMQMSWVSDDLSYATRYTWHAWQSGMSWNASIHRYEYSYLD